MLKFVLKGLNFSDEIFPHCFANTREKIIIFSFSISEMANLCVEKSFYCKLIIKSRLCLMIHSQTLSYLKHTHTLAIESSLNLCKSVAHLT